MGLIINELVSNSLKYAFPDNQTGRVMVKLYSDSEHHLTLIVSDDGIGFPESLDLKDMKSLGLQIVMDLAGQLAGTVVLNRTPGTKFQITFPVDVAGSERLP